jgi:hypothetical protein
MPGSSHTGAGQRIAVWVRATLEEHRDSGDIYEERSLVLRGCGGIGRTWMGRRRVGVGPPGGVGFRVVFSGRDSCSVPRIGCLGVSCPCSSVAVGSGPVGSAICVDAGISGHRKSIPSRIDHERRTCGPSNSRCPVWCISQSKDGIRGGHQGRWSTASVSWSHTYERRSP